MKISQTGINLIKEFEGCRLTAYKCPAGVWTIGYGHTGNVKQGQKITAKQAEDYLKKDLERFERHVMAFNDKYKWNQNQFDALVSFAFNVGSINQLTANGTRTIAEISAKLTAYSKAAGKELAGLVRRRKAEKELFDKQVKVKPVPALSVDEIAKEVVDGKWGNDDARKAALEAAGYDYDKVQAKVNELIKTTAAKASAKTLKKGTKVKIKSGARDANTGTKYASFVYVNTYQVHSISGDYVVFGDGKTATGKTKKSNVALV